MKPPPIATTHTPLVEQKWPDGFWVSQLQIRQQCQGTENMSILNSKVLTEVEKRMGRVTGSCMRQIMNRGWVGELAVKCRALRWMESREASVQGMGAILYFSVTFLPSLMPSVPSVNPLTEGRLSSSLFLATKKPYKCLEIKHNQFQC